MAEEKKTKEKKEVKPVEIKPGMTIKVLELIKEKNANGVEKERIQIFEGIVLDLKHK